MGRGWGKNQGYSLISSLLPPTFLLPKFSLVSNSNHLFSFTFCGPEMNNLLLYRGDKQSREWFTSPGAGTEFSVLFSARCREIGHALSEKDGWFKPITLCSSIALKTSKLHIVT